MLSGCSCDYTWQMWLSTSSRSSSSLSKNFRSFIFFSSTEPTSTSPTEIADQSGHLVRDRGRLLLALMIVRDLLLNLTDFLGHASLVVLMGLHASSLQQVLQLLEV